MKHSVLVFIVFSLILAGCSASKLTTKGFNNLNSGNVSKAKIKFFKALDKDINYSSAYYGLSLAFKKQGTIGKAIQYGTTAFEKNKNADYAFNLSSLYAQNSNREMAYNFLFKIGDFGRISNFKDKILNNKEFDFLRSEAKMKRLIYGYRRTKIEIVEGRSRLEDKFTQNDQFATVSAKIENEDKLILCTYVIQDKNRALWNNQYVIFDYQLGTDVTIASFDEDYTYHDILTKDKSILETDDYRSYWNNTSNSSLNIVVSDTDDDCYTAGTTIPSTLPRGFVEVAGAAAVVYGIKELFFSGGGSSNSSSSSYSPSGSVVHEEVDNSKKEHFWKCKQNNKFITIIQKGEVYSVGQNNFNSLSQAERFACIQTNCSNCN